MGDIDRPAVRIVGPGRAGTSLARALELAGWNVAPVLGRDDDIAAAARGVDVVVLAVPDGAVRQVARAVTPAPGTVVVHLAGSLGLDVLDPHPRRAALHPLISLPNPEIGAQRLRGAWFAVAGDPLAGDIARALHGRIFAVADGDRALYHAAASIAANHLVALMGQVERVATAVGVPLDAYLDLARASLDNVASLGPAGAITGPAARGDEATIESHLQALPEEERAAYRALSREARRLATDAGPHARSGDHVTSPTSHQSDRNGS